MLSYRDSPVQLGDFLSELQSVREDRKRRQGQEQERGKVQGLEGSQEQETDSEEQLSSKALTARLAAKELETLQVGN